MFLISSLIKGLIFGFSIAVPVGPLSILCMRRTMSHGRLYGVVSGLGVATADALYAAIAIFGLGFITHLLVAWQLELRLIGGCFLLYLGIRTLCTKAPSLHARLEVNHNHSAATFRNGYATTFLLTLTNPMTILAFAALFVSIQENEPALTSLEKYLANLLLVGGAFLGSSIWWLMLVEFVAHVHRKVNPRILEATHWLSGALVIGFAGWILWSTL